MKNVVKKLKEADKSQGYFVTITTLNGGKLKHYQTQRNFPKEDLLPSLEQINDLVLKDLQKRKMI